MDGDSEATPALVQTVCRYADLPAGVVERARTKPWGHAADTATFLANVLTAPSYSQGERKLDALILFRVLLPKLVASDDPGAHDAASKLLRSNAWGPSRLGQHDANPLALLLTPAYRNADAPARLLDLARILVEEKGVDVDAVSGPNIAARLGYSPLHMAVIRNCTAVFAYLMERGADVLQLPWVSPGYLPSVAGWPPVSPLLLAEELGRWEILDACRPRLAQRVATRWPEIDEATALALSSRNATFLLEAGFPTCAEASRRQRSIEASSRELHRHPWSAQRVTFGRFYAKLKASRQDTIMGTAREWRLILENSESRTAEERAGLLRAMDAVLGIGEARPTQVPSLDLLMQFARRMLPELTFIVPYGSYSRFGDAMPAYSQGFGLAAAGGYHRFAAPNGQIIRTITVSPAEHEEFAETLAHELGHCWGAALALGAGKAHPNWFADLFPRGAYSEATLNIRQLGEMDREVFSSIAEIYPASAHLDEAFTRLYFHLPCRWLLQGQDSHSIVERIDTILTGASVAFARNARPDERRREADHIIEA